MPIYHAKNGASCPAGDLDIGEESWHQGENKLAYVIGNMI